MNKRSLSVTVLAIAAIALASFFYWERAAKAPDGTAAGTAQPKLVRKGATITIPDGSPYRDRIKVATTEIREVREARSFPAVVEADPARTTGVLPPVPGRIVDLNVQLSDKVKQGQVLMRLESGDLAQAQSDRAKAQAQVDLSKRAFDRTRDLSKIGGAAVKDFEQVQSDFAQATAELNRADERLRVIGMRGQITGPANVNIVAPFDGTVTSLSAARGAYVNDVTASLMTIANLDKVFVTASAPEKDIGFVRPDATATVQMLAYPDNIVSARITTVNVILDPDTRRVKLRINFDNADGRLLPNMFGTVTVQAPAMRSVVVPTSALVMLNDDVFVFVETAPWTFERRLVFTGADVNGFAPVRQGLKGGEPIVVRGGVLLSD